MTEAARASGGGSANSLVRSNLIVAAGTALSRLTGFARLALFGVIFGRAALWDAYNAANNSPNMIYELVLGGVLSATLVPIFTRLFADADDEAVAAVFSTSIIAVAGLTTVGVVLAPLIFRLTAINVSDAVDPADYRWLGTAFARIFLIQILFYGLSALWGAMLNARKRFFAPAWSPILANVAIIVSLLVADSKLEEGEEGFAAALSNAGFRNTLALGATLGISLQAFALYPALRRAGIRLRFRPDWSHPAVRTVFRLSGWTLGYAAANVAASLVIQNLAEPGSGDVSAYTLAFTFFLLPHALLAMSILTTFVPDLAGFVKRRDRRGFVDRMSLGIRLVALVTVPAGFGLFVLRQPIIGGLMEHGSFDRLDTLVTSRALAGFALGLAGFSVYLFVLRGFYSHQDTRTAFVINLFQNLLNVVLAVLLVGRFDVLGLGAAFALSYVIAAVWAMFVLRNKVGALDVPGLLIDMACMVLAALVMAQSIWFLSRAVGSNQGMGALARVLAGLAIGPLIYGSLMAAMASPALRRSLRSLRRA